MTNNVCLTSAAAVLCLLALGGPGLAQQTSVYRSIDAASGKAVRVRVVTSLKKDCTVGPAAEVKVLTTPKNGDIVVRNDKMKTPANFRCPNVETPVQIVWYKSKPNFVGSDDLALQIKTPDGPVQSINIKMNVGEKAGAAKSDAEL
jgi:hypothetical protein